MTTRSYDRPFADIAVVDLSQGIAGPFCGMLLAAHGASVVKVEPAGGDWSRHLGTCHGEHTALEMAANRGKRSIALDLKTAEGLAIVHRLIDGCDVVIESFRPGVADRLGIGYEQVRERNRRALYASISGFGSTGPYAPRPCTDTVGQAFSGIMALNRDDEGSPMKIGFVVVDTATAQFAFQAIATSLYARGEEGRRIDVSLMQSAAAFIAPKIVEAHLEGSRPRLPNVPAGSYRARDGWIAVTLVRDEHFRALCDVLERPELAADPRFASGQKRADAAGELVPMIAQAIRGWNAAELIERLAAADVLCSRVNEVVEWLDDPHVRAVGAAPMMAQGEVGAVPMPRIPGLTDAAIDNLAAPSPGLGEHGREVLAELSYAPERIDALAASGALHLPEAGAPRAAE